MNQPIVALVITVLVASLALAGCGQAAPAPTPTKAPAVPTRAAEPTKAPAAPTKAAEPTKPAAAAPQPTPAPVKKVDFPTRGKAISLIMPFTAGGPTDLAGRLVAAGMEKELGTAVEVVAKTGAGGQVGMTELAQSKPDGYTISASAFPTIIMFYLDPDRKATFTNKSFQHLALHVVDPTTLAVRADSPYKSMKDIVDDAKANPEKVKIATVSPLQADHLAFLRLEKMTGAKFAFVFAGGAPEGINALLGGHVDADAAQVGVFPSVLKAGQVRLLGVADSRESRFAPGVKTFEAQGYKLYSASHRGYSAPAGVPREIVDILSGAMKKVIESSEHVKKMEEMGMDVRFAGPDEFSKLWADAENDLRPLLDEARAQMKK